MRIIDEAFMAQLKAVEWRLWAKVEKTDDCWNWLGGKTRYGYGRFHVRGEMISAHRATYLLKVGPIPEGFIVDHICHNTTCVRPEHLRAATNKQNTENVADVSKTNTTGYTGVYLDRRRKARPWTTRVVHNGKFISAGAYATAEEANAAVTAKRNELFTHNDRDRDAADAMPVEVPGEAMAAAVRAFREDVAADGSIDQALIKAVIAAAPHVWKQAYRVGHSDSATGTWRNVA